ncbi:MAG: polysaccharide biosynthesis C-terminal domain-containing protein [Ignavibacteriales bacterium]|nr:MAG: hypothetical protein F9K26_07380 [Ignavibacteriaceae bacterium]MBW7872931.1 polysaccharide biosynthesis C-terminal domain-containing protein [Ignavibacteria bacterium]MCZ2142440.1 polysaccharide biosynthesis C-terminal domain-containing protein [Ignavibacteriales bacterium]MBV6445322.1 Lipid II flippase MurJ [Ignavibacteriaceae bacterium]MBZ0196864.1 polysaccharide biosynthesis C-terminal domain-containing protein [Ignavibacteriaceae bacterium]
MNTRLKKIFTGVSGAALIVVLAQLLSKGTGFFREALFAGEFGVGKDFEFYLIAYTIPGIINSVLFYQAQNYFIPIYNELKQKKSEEASSFLTSSFFFFTIFVTILAAALYFLTKPIVGLFLSNLSFADFAKVSILFQFALITLPLSGMISVLSAWLVAELKFTVTYFSQIWTNISIIAVVFFFGEQLGTMAIVVGFVAGNFLQLLNLFWGGKPLLNSGFRLKFAFTGKMVWFVFLNTLFVEIAGQLFIFIDRLFYSNTDPGGIAALNYSTIIYLLPLSTFTAALGSALLPDFSENVAKGDVREANAKFTKAIEVIFLLFIPATVVFIFSGQDIISLIFQRGKFDVNSTIMTAETLLFYSLSLIFYAIFAIGIKYAYSLKGSGVLVIISIVGLIAKYLFSFLLSHEMKQNGLALATSLTYITQSLLCVFYIYKSANFRVNKDLAKNFTLVSLWSGVVLGVSLFLISQFKLTSLVLPFGFILLYPIILHLTKNRVYGEITSKFIGPR